jgi:outer membrane lipoprotein-sorting protein
MYPPKEILVPVFTILTRRSVLGAACIALLAAATIPAPSPAQTERSLSPAWTEFSRTWAEIPGYSAKITIFEQKGGQAQNIVLNYEYSKPSNAVVQIMQGKNAGVTLVWNGGSTMQAHRSSGLLSSFKKTLAVNDPVATTIRGSSIDQISFDAILAHAQQTPGAVAQTAGAAIDGMATDEVRLTPSSASDGLTLEVVDVSKTTHLPVRILGYEGSTLVRSIYFSDVKLQSHA